MIRQAGFDGKYGVIRLFQEGELDAFSGQFHLPGDVIPVVKKTNKKRKPVSLTPLPKDRPTSTSEKSELVLHYSQIRVIEKAKGISLVKAGPGTGKTGTLVRWIAHRIKKNNAQPREVLAITFTNRAADEMRERLAAMLDKREGLPTVGTFHAICFRLFQDQFPHLQTVYDETVRLSALRLLFPEWGEKLRRKTVRALAVCLESGKPDPSLSKIISTYRKFLWERGGIDVADLVGGITPLWERMPGWLEAVRKRYPVLAVDELQDINVAQYRFLTLLAQGREVLAIGDPDQAIYSFRGADQRLFFRFKRELKARVFSLDQNFRCPNIVVEAANSLIRHNAEREEVTISGGKNGITSIPWFHAADAREEAEYLLSLIEHYVGGSSHLAMELLAERSGSYAFSDIAVLFRLHSLGKELWKHLRRANIPVHLGGGTSLLTEMPFCLVTDALRFFRNERDIISLGSILSHELNLDADRVYSFLTAWEKSKEKETPLAKEAHSTLEKYLDFFHSLPDTLAKGGVISLVEAILKRFVPQSFSDEILAFKQETILHLARDAEGDVETFLRRAVLSPFNDGGHLRSQGVHLLTFHAAKGLEFPVVLIAGAEEGITPIERKDTSLEEERRLFYVALTRTKERLHITCSKKRHRYGQMVAAEPSRFLNEISGNILQPVERREKKPSSPDTQLSLW